LICYIAFPQVVVQHFVNCLKPTDMPKAPFYAAIVRDLQPMSIGKADMLEELGRICIITRFQENLFGLKGTFGSLLPFLRDSYVFDCSLVQPLQTYCFPKIMTSGNFDEIAVKELLSREYNGETKSGSYCQVSQDDWMSLTYLVKPGVFYVAAPASSSGDVYSFLNSKFWGEVIFTVQMKSGGQYLVLKHICEEAEKTFVDPLPEKYKMCLVIAATHIGTVVTEFESKTVTKEENEFITWSAGTKVDYRGYKSPTDHTIVDKTYTVPKKLSNFNITEKQL